MAQQTVIATGTGTFTVPGNVTSLTIEAWGGGGAGTGTNSTSAPGGGGGGYSFAVVSVTPGQTVFYNVGAGGTGSANVGTPGGVSWVNPAANSQPSSNGVVAAGGSAGTTGAQAGGAGSVGTTNFTGGSSADGNGATPIGGGGGGGASSAGNGGNAAGSVAGVAGSPDGGAGAAGVTNGAASPGTQPGGGGGGSWFNNGGSGGNGQVRFTWAGGPLVTTTLTKAGRYFSRKDYADWLAKIIGENVESRREYEKLIGEAEEERKLTDIQRADRDFDGAENEFNQSEAALYGNLTAANHAKMMEAKEKIDRARKKRDHQYFMEVVNKEWAKHNESKAKRH